MKAYYMARYGHPNWDWRPTACGDDNDGNDVGTGFTDNHLVAGMTSIRAIHVTELRERIDVQRVRFGLAAFLWTDATVVAGVTPVKAVHLMELRTALDDVYAVVESHSPVYTDVSILPGVTPIRAVHLMELQMAVFTLERSDVR